MRFRFTFLAVFVCSLLHCVGGSFFTDFESTPPRTGIYENAIINPGGGVGDSGVLRLTPTELNRVGTFIVDDLDGGRAVAGFIIKFKLQIAGGGQVGADGISVNVGAKLPIPIIEYGITRDFTLTFDTYVGNGTKPPELIAKYHGKVLGTYPVPAMRTPGRFVEVEIRMDPKGVLNVFFDSEHKIKNLAYPQYKPITGAQFGFGSRTAGRFDNHLIDDLSIVTAVVGESLPKTAAPRLEPAKAAERAWFMNGTEVLQGCIYKPAGEGPFPAVILDDGHPTALPDDGMINPLPEIGGLFMSKGYVLFLPGTYDFKAEEAAIHSEGAADQHQKLLELQQRQGERLRAAARWLEVQSFVDQRRIVAVGRGRGAVTALFGLSQDNGVRGLAFFAGEGKSFDPVASHVASAIAAAKCPMTLFYPERHKQQPFVQTFETGLTGKRFTCHAITAAGASPWTSMPQMDLWSEDLLAFFEAATR